MKCGMAILRLQVGVIDSLEAIDRMEPTALEVVGGANSC